MCVGDAVSTADQTSSMPLTESPKVLQASTILEPLDEHLCVTNDTTATPTDSTMEVVQDATSMAPSRSLMLCENQPYMIRECETSIPDTPAASLKRFWKHAVSFTMNLPPLLLSLVGWRSNYTPISQERLALQMLIVNGSVRASNVEFRYSTSQEEAKSLSRSFTVIPPSDRQHLTPIQAFQARLQSRGGQLIQRLRMQDAYGRFCARGTQVFDRVRRELTIRSYVSRT